MEVAKLLFLLGSCPVRIRVRVRFVSGFVSGSCLVHVRFVSGSIRFVFGLYLFCVRFVIGSVFGFVFGFAFGFV